MENYKELEVGYYVINNTKRVLYWDGEQWKKPIKDRMGRLGSYISHLEKQPKVKSTTPVEETEYASLYKPW